MNKRNIIILSVLSALVLIGMVALQLYWIKSSVKIKEADFKDDIYRSFAIVMKKVDQLEKEKKRAEMYKYLSDLYKNKPLESDSNFQSYYFQQQYNNGQLSISFSNPNMGKQFEKIVTNPVFKKKESARKSLDSIIYKVLDKQNIKTKYYFNVFDNNNNKFLLNSKQGNLDNYKNSKFSFPFYSNNLFQQYYLTIYFPNEKGFLLRRMGFMLSLSTVLILSLISLFTYTIYTIVKQKKLSEMKNDFINNMTHEFKTPISTVSLACQALSDNEIQKTPELYNSYINIIDQENKRLGSMAEKILKTAIIDKGELKLKTEEFNIDQLIEESIKNFKLQIEERGGQLITNFNSDIKNIKADRNLIGDVILNLVENANKYTPENPKIIISTSSTDEWLMISVKDNGIGISKSNQQKIFDKLYRVPKGNIHDVKGFGLGLSFVKAIVDAHNGEVKVESQIRKGSNFIIYLPIKK